jgi:hypothetical protein
VTPGTTACVYRKRATRRRHVFKFAEAARALSGGGELVRDQRRPAHTQLAGKGLLGEPAAEGAIAHRNDALCSSVRIEPGAAPPARAHTCAMLCIPARRITLNASGPTPRSRSSRLGNICECSSDRVQKSDGIGAHCESRADLGAPKAGASAS